MSSLYVLNKNNWQNPVVCKTLAELLLAQLLTPIFSKVLLTRDYFENCFKINSYFGEQKQK